MTNKSADIDIRLNDRNLFGNDAAEDEDIEILNSYFTDKPDFDDFLDPQARFQIAVARKGMGKSALLSEFAYRLSKIDTKPLIISARPAALVAILPPPQTENTVLLENYWKQVICKAINLELANTIGFAWRDDSIAIVESSELAGFKNKNLIGALAGRLISKINLFGAIEIKNDVKPIPNDQQVLRRIQEEGHDGRDVWFLLDDIDSNFVNTAQQRVFVSSFFTASRDIIREIKGISIRATLRADVLNSLQKIEDTDKWIQYTREFSWSNNEQKQLLVQRIYAYVIRKHSDSNIAKNWDPRVHADNYIGLAFANRLKWGGTVAPPINVLKIFAAGRPRWMVQLCRLSGQKAASNHVSRITSNEINMIMPMFGKLRLSDLYREYEHRFSDLKKVVEVFSNGPSQYTTNELFDRIFKSYIKNRSANTIPDIDGDPYRNSVQIARFLFKSGFILGHKLDGVTLETPEFISYDLRPDLLEVDTNLDDNMRWEIQMSYRKALSIK